MTTGHFLVVALVAALVAATLLALAAALDAPVLYVPALLAVAVILGAREGWLWAGDRRGWIAMVGTLVATIAAVYLLQRLW